MNPRKEQIYAALEQMKRENRAAQERLTKEASLEDYRSLARTDMQDDVPITVWSDAFQKALDENEILRIPASDEVYYIDRPIRIPSDRRITADDGAVIRLRKGVPTLMFRNVHTADGTHTPIVSDCRDRNIAIIGGRWEESLEGRRGYGRSGMYDENRSYYGVSTCMFFNNMDGLTLRNMTFAHCGGFVVQTGDITGMDIDNITFVECYADGLHLNGNTENVSVTNIRGQVGDDLVALNMYDWQNSSVDFGPTKTVLCENLELSADSGYKALRIEPGVYYYDDGSSVDCGLYDTIIKNVRGINTFKLYYQTPAYRIVGGEPERGGPGSGAVGCKAHLAAYLPKSATVEEPGHIQVKAFCGNFLVVVKALTYILSLGKEGIPEAARNAVLNANYLLTRIRGTFEPAFDRICMHEFVLDLSRFKKETGVSALDVAKSLIDNGMHPPTMYFPLIVHEALMLEPTETESRETLDWAAEVFRRLYELGYKDPVYMHGAPHNAQIGRPDEVMAARNPILRYQP